jgi:hypothetical protein
MASGAPAAPAGETPGWRAEILTGSALGPTANSSGGPRPHTSATRRSSDGRSPTCVVGSQLPPPTEPTSSCGLGNASEPLVGWLGRWRSSSVRCRSPTVAISRAELADRHGLPGRTFERQPAGVSPTGATGFIQRAVEAIGEADQALTDLQDSMLPVEVGDAALRSALADVGERYAGYPSGPASCRASWAAERRCPRQASVAAASTAREGPVGQRVGGRAEGFVEAVSDQRKRRPQMAVPSRLQGRRSRSRVPEARKGGRATMQMNRPAGIALGPCCAKKPSTSCRRVAVTLSPWGVRLLRVAVPSGAARSS